MARAGHLAAAPRRGVISARAVAQTIVLMAIATSCIVFTEPAPADVLLMAAIAALTVLGLTRPGASTIAMFALWLVHLSAAFLVLFLTPTMASALPHNGITLYLALATCLVAGWISDDPARRFDLVARAYVVAVLIAVAAGIAGYFDLLSGADELFTNYGRARGTFKDPNVFGAALVPALVYLAWQTLHAPRRQALAALALALPIGFGLLLSFSRGAWFSAAAALAFIGIFTLAGARSPARQLRLLIVAGTLAIVLIGGLLAATHLDSVGALLSERASLTQSYDVGSEGRFGGQSKAIDLIVENPFGIGTHTFRERYHHEEAHNVYLSLLLNGGWIGGGAYALMIILTLAAGLRQCVRGGSLQAPQIIATAAFLGLAIEGFVVDTDHWRHFFIVQAMVLGLADGRLGAVRRAAIVPAQTVAVGRMPLLASLPNPPTPRRAARLARSVTAPSGRARRAARLRAG